MATITTAAALTVALSHTLILANLRMPIGAMTTRSKADSGQCS